MLKDLNILIGKNGSGKSYLLRKYDPVYHFLSPDGSKESKSVKCLQSNGKNIRVFLNYLQENYTSSYDEICQAIKLAIPFFEDNGWPYLSVGSIRFICLASALLQPQPPSTIVIDEPELGLHPEAIRILGELIADAAKRTQVIISTQSPLLIAQFSIEDIVVVNRQGGQSTFKRLAFENFSEWLETYSIGELWTKNIIQA